MNKGENSGSIIPIDLINEIFSRLPAKSVTRFSCLSKQWRDMLDCPYFKELFFTRSSAWPRLLFSVQRDGCSCYFSSPQPHNLYLKLSSLVVTADFHMKLPKHMPSRYGKHAFGLVYCYWRMGMVIFNPSTGQLVQLPKDNRLSTINYLGFDPVDEQFKVLSMSNQFLLTLGTDDSWEKIYCPLNDLSIYCFPEGICINGVLYYFAVNDSYLLVCFDFRSEEFKFINVDFITFRDSTKMINYMGKLGVINLEYDYNPWDWDPKDSRGRKCFLKLSMLVLRDVDDPNSEWSEHVYTFRKTNQCVGCSHVSTLWENQIVSGDVSVVGVTATGEVVLCIDDVSKTLYVFYLNIERKTLNELNSELLTMKLLRNVVAEIYSLWTMWRIFNLLIRRLDMMQHLYIS